MLSTMFDGIKAVIFDLDGTLVDSMRMWKQIDIDYLSGFGLECPEDLQSKIEGMSFSETALYFKNRFQIPDSVEKIKQDWNNMANEKYRNEVPLKEGALTLLSELKRKGIFTGIATSNSRTLVDTILDSLQIKEYFDAIHTACEVEKGKPAPDIYLYVAKMLGVEAVDCLVFEDIPYGILAGKNAGMKVCGVEDSYSAVLREEKQKLSDYYISSFCELGVDKDISRV